jgi:ribonuclease HI
LGSEIGPLAYNTGMPWLKHRLRDADVWAKVDEGGALVTDRDGRVEIVYKPNDGARVYRAGARNLTAVPNSPPVDITVGEAAAEKASAGAKAKPAAATSATAAAQAQIDKAPENAIHVWTDGACSGNPGPAGLGVVVLDGTERKELSEYLGEGTNNIAELTAILRGLQEIKDRARPVVVYTDSQFSIDMMTKGWKAKKNIELVAEVRAMCRQFPDLRFVWIRGHANVPLNMRCDELARQAVSRRR